MTQLVATSPPAARPKRGAWLVPAVLVSAFVAALLLYGCHNDFPHRYHADEGLKAEQLIQNDRNFNHPLLMLEAARGVVKLAGVPAETQQLVQAGRWVSAGFSALSVVLLGLAAWVLRGRLAAVCVTLAVLLCHPLLTYAHYFKEDTALVFGWAAFALAAAWYWRRPGPVAAALLGLACALAVSSKYIGVLAPLLAPGLILAARGGRGGPPADEASDAQAPAAGQARPWWRCEPVLRLNRLLLFLLVLAVAALAINWRILSKWEVFRANAIGYEWTHVVTEHRGLTADRPNWYWVGQLAREVTLPVALLAGACLVLLVVRWRRRPVVECVLLALGVIYFVSVLWTVFPFNRYLLPVMVGLHFLAGLAVADLVELALGRRWERAGIAVAGLGAGAVLALQVALCADYLGQFRDDGRQQLEAWVLRHLPAGTRVAQDTYAGLPKPPALGTVVPPGQMQARCIISPLGFGVDFGYAAWQAQGCPEDWDMVVELRKLGFTHVAVTDLAYERFFTPWLRPLDPAAPESWSWPRRCFEQLFDPASGTRLIWQSRPLRPMGAYTNPTVLLYELPRPPAPPATQPATSPATRPATRPATAPAPPTAVPAPVGSLPAPPGARPVLPRVPRN